MKKIIFINIKVLRGNFFLSISNFLSKLLFTKSCGNFGFTNVKKRSKDAFQILLLSGIQFMLNLDQGSKLFIKIEGANKEFLQQIHSQFVNVLRSSNFNICVIKLVNKISHNGCRKPYFRT